MEVGVESVNVCTGLAVEPRDKSSDWEFVLFLELLVVLRIVGYVGCDALLVSVSVHMVRARGSPYMCSAARMGSYGLLLNVAVKSATRLTGASIRIFV